MGVATESLDPTHNYVPWLVIDGEHTEDKQSEAMEDLLAYVCNAYQVNRKINYKS